MRGKAFERRRIDDGVGAVRGPEIAGQAVAHIEIAICEFDGEIRRDPVSKACMKRPGEIPSRHIVAECQPRRYAGAGDGQVAEVCNRDPRPAGAGAGTYIGGGAMVMSAANAIDDNNDAAPAATRDLTLRIGFALLCGEAGNGGLTSQNSPPDDGTESLSAA